MNKRVKITSFAAAALATVFLVGANSHSIVKADATGDTSNSKVEKRQNSSSTGENQNSQSDATGEDNSDNSSGKQQHLDDDDDNAPIPDEKIKNPPVPDDVKAEAKELTVRYKKAVTNINWKTNLTEDDVDDYVSSNTLYYAGGEKINAHGNFSRYGRFNTSDSRQKEIDDPNHASVKLMPGDTYYIQPMVYDGLQPNTWYKWKYYEYDFNDDNTGLDVTHEFDVNGLLSSYNDSPELEKELSKRIAFDDDTHYIYQRTGEDGSLPSTIDYDDPDFPDYLSNDSFGPILAIHITQNEGGADIPYSDDNDYVHTYDHHPKNNNVDNEVPNIDSASDSNFNKNSSVDSSDNSSFEDDSNTVNQLIDPDKLVENQDNESGSVSAENEKENNDTENIVKNVPLMFKKVATIYDSNGNPVVSKGSYITASKYTYLNALDGGKKVNINGQYYYRVGKNKYVKVLDTVKRNTRRINYKARIIIKKGKKLRLVNYLNNKISKFLTKPKSVKLDRKRKIGDTTIYHIKGTKYWIRAKNVKLA